MGLLRARFLTAVLAGAAAPAAGAAAAAAGAAAEAGGRPRRRRRRTTGAAAAALAPLPGGRPGPRFAGAAAEAPAALRSDVRRFSRSLISRCISLTYRFSSPGETRRSASIRSNTYVACPDDKEGELDCCFGLGTIDSSYLLPDHHNNIVNTFTSFLPPWKRKRRASRLAFMGNSDVFTAQ
jgi:hypothetical protein